MNNKNINLNGVKETMYTGLTALMAVLIESSYMESFFSNEGLMSLFLFGSIALLGIFLFNVKIGTKLYLLILLGVMILVFHRVGGTGLFVSFCFGNIILICLHGKSELFF